MSTISTDATLDRAWRTFERQEMPSEEPGSISGDHFRGTKSSQISSESSAALQLASRRTCRKVCRTESRASSDSNQVILLGASSQQNQTPTNRLLSRNALSKIRDAPVVHVDAPGLHQPPRFTLRRR